MATIPYQYTIQITASPNNSKKELVEQLKDSLERMLREVKQTGHLCQGVTSQYGVSCSITHNI